jgi:hypothetical protein
VLCGGGGGGCLPPRKWLSDPLFPSILVIGLKMELAAAAALEVVAGFSSTFFSFLGLCAAPQLSLRVLSCCPKGPLLTDPFLRACEARPLLGLGVLTAPEAVQVEEVGSLGGGMLSNFTAAVP